MRKRSTVLQMSYKVVTTVRGHVGGVFCILADEESERVWTGSNDFTVREWDSRTRESTRQLTGHANGVRSLLKVRQVPRRA
jgi:WD40 repeat protein